MLKNTSKTVGTLNEKVEKFEIRLLEALSRSDGVVSSLQRASKVTVSEESKRALAEGNDSICRQITERMKSEGVKIATVNLLVQQYINVKYGNSKN